MTIKPMRYTLRALACLLSYPNHAVRDQLPHLPEVLGKEAVLTTQRQRELQDLITWLLNQDQLEAEAYYVETFDRGRATSLHLFEHVHGDSRDRGSAMADLVQTYQQSGLQLSPDELPDHLCVILEFSSTQPPTLAREFLAEMAHILNAIFSALLKRKSPYASVLAAVLELSGHKACAIPLPPEIPMDENWQEPAAFEGCHAQGQKRPEEPQPVHLLRRTKSTTPGSPT